MAEDYRTILEDMVSVPDRPVADPVSTVDKVEGSHGELASSLSAKIQPKSITPPRNTLEENLMEIWQDTIGTDGFGVDDDFLELGGHSLLAVKIIVRIRDQLGYHLSLRELFERGTIAGIAEQIQGVKEE